MVSLVCVALVFFSCCPLTTAGQFQIRLMGSSLAYQGRVEVFHSGVWGTVCDDYFDLDDATVVCHQLGYVSAVSYKFNAYFGAGTGQIWMDDVGCAGSESALQLCNFGGWGIHNCAHSEDVGVVCHNFTNATMDSVRLSGSTLPNQGRVEVYHDGVWGTVCDDGWDMDNSNVLCHQLGYSSAVSYKLGAYFGTGFGHIWMDNVNCAGSESELQMCSFNGWGVNDCSHSEDVGVVCHVGQVSTTTPTTLLKVRLSGSAWANQGRVEVYHSGEWGTVCDDSWDMQDASVVCHQLGFVGASSFTGNAYYGLGTGRIWMDDVDCTGNEMDLQNCHFPGWSVNDCTHSEDAGVDCHTSTSATSTLDVRLSGSFLPNQGRVEVYHGGVWGTVCDDSWDLLDSDVICRQLGYSSAVSYKPNAYFGAGFGQIWMDDVNCAGNEHELRACPFNGWGDNNCQHSEDVGVVCRAIENNSCSGEGNVRLVGGSSDAEGRVEVCHNGQWGTVCDDLWDDHDAYVVCNELGYLTESGAAKSRAYFGSGTGPIWMDDVQCAGNEQSLKYCNFPGFGSNDCIHSEDAGVTCSIATSNSNAKSKDFKLIVGLTVSSTGVIFIVVVVVCVIVRRRRRHRGRMATYSVVMRHGQDGDQSCLIVNQQPAAQVMPVGCYIPESPVAGKLAFGPPPTEKGVLEPIAPFQSYLAQSFTTVTQPMLFTAQLPEFSSHGQQPVQNSETM